MHVNDLSHWKLFKIVGSAARVRAGLCVCMVWLLTILTAAVVGRSSNNHVAHTPDTD